MSQPSTKIFLCTSEPHAAKWISDTIGEQEIERIRESRTNEQFPQSRKSKGYNLEREIRPLVMASEISGLEKMHGYLKCGNLVARMSLPYIGLESREPQYIERPAQQQTRNRRRLRRPRREQASRRGTELRDRHSCPMNSNKVRTRKSNERASTPAKGLLRVGQHMLTISKPLSAGQAQSYHAEEFGNARENYYTETGADSRGVARKVGRAVGTTRRGSRRALPTALGRTTPDHWRTTNPLPSRQRIREQARREGKRNGTPCRMGRDVFGPEERIVDRPGRSR